MDDGQPPSPEAPRSAPPRPSHWGLLGDEALLELSLHRGDAFAVLVERHHDRLWRYLRNQVGAERADDALAELWEIGYRRRHTFDHHRGSVSGWFFGIARNVSHHLRRRESQARALNDRLEAREGRRRADADLADRVADLEFVSRVKEAIELLPGHERVVVDLVIVDGLSYQAAADALGLPVGTIRSRLSRAKGRLWYVASSSP